MTADHSDLDETKILDDSASEPTPAGRKADQKSRVRAALFDERPLARERIGRFILLDTLGEGGMGTVLEAYDETLDRKVAVKILHPAIAEGNAKRLVREAQALAKLSHPNVVGVYEVGSFEGRTFIAMELVRGETLKQWQGQDPRPGWRECVEVYVQAGQGLAAAHAVGLVHRDFKPGNCIIDSEGRVRVLDFGLVRGLDTAPADEPAGASPLLRPTDDALETSLTRTGTVLGTVAYMPLEQLSGERADVRSDQFSFCVSLYEIHPRGSQPRGTTRLLAEMLGILRGCPLVPSGRGWTGVGTVRARSCSMGPRANGGQRGDRRNAAGPCGRLSDDTVRASTGRPGRLGRWPRLECPESVQPSDGPPHGPSGLWCGRYSSRTVLQALVTVSHHRDAGSFPRHPFVEPRQNQPWYSRGTNP